MNKNISNRPAPFAKKSFGQNFLIDEAYIRKIVHAACIGNNDTVLEIGPGRGALTTHLVEKAGRVIAIELDAELLPLLEKEFGGHSNFEIIQADILKLDLAPFAVDKNLKLIANLPYYISTAILQRLIEHRQLFSLMVLMFQREIVDRIVARPGNSDRGYLTVLVESFLDVEKLFDVPPLAFKPSPKVWSSVVRITPKNSRTRFADNEKLFERLVSAAFRQKRKTILNNLKAASDLKIVNPADLLRRSRIETSRRAESLTLEEWERLLMNYAASSEM